MDHESGAPVTTMELERLPDGRQRFSVGVTRSDGTEIVMHLFGEMLLETVANQPDHPLNYKLVFTPKPGSGVLGEIRIAVPDDLLGP